jgi:hypothetical protein
VECGYGASGHGGGRNRDRFQAMKAALGILAVVVLLSGQIPGQETRSSTPAKNPWAYNLTVDGYIVPKNQSYVDPILTADRNWLHLEARYNYEDLKTGSLWVGYNFARGKKWVLDVTPMVGGVFGRTTGISSGCEASLSYKQIELSVSNEYVFEALHAGLEVQSGFLVGVSHKKWEFTTYIFNAGIKDPTVALETGVDF